MKRAGKIHFVHHLEKRGVPANLGDWICSPFYYFFEYFSQYSCVLHSDWAVLWHEIERNDIVIFGGGGLIDNSNELNVVLNRLLDRCDNVIIWGAGTHRYNQDNIFGKATADVAVKFERALLVGVRDYQHPSGLPYVPCVSCMNEAFSIGSKNAPIQRKVGTIKSALETTFAVADVPSFVTNADSIGNVARYIRTSETILVSSYHGAYWAMLLGKNPVLPATRLGVDKYRYFRHPVAFFEGTKYDEDLILTLARNLPDVSGFLAESRQITLDFFESCKVHIEERLSPSPSRNTYETIVGLARRNAQLEFTIIDMLNEIRRMKGRLDKLEQTQKSN